MRVAVVNCAIENYCSNFGEWCFEISPLHSVNSIAHIQALLATIYDSELESPSPVSILSRNPGGLSNPELCQLYKWAAAPEVFYSKCVEDQKDSYYIHSDIWLVNVVALELAYRNLRISSHEDFVAMIKKIERLRRLPDKLEDLLEEINVEERGKRK
ncbi:hypothetical protein H5410_028035 [Solanum commersonii]|uniref:Uncharacterized protein n=1 Tax=Solanum commersonii TaxID=4109 RepID=A0A9J5Z3T9_SOLCO|nr:hypothetical protein H5410_028035 [Solanum commersonii]